MVLLAVKQVSEAVKDGKNLRQRTDGCNPPDNWQRDLRFYRNRRSPLDVHDGPARIALRGFEGPGMFGSNAVLVVIGILIAGLIAMWVIQIIAARFLWKGYEGITDKTGTKTFKSVGRW